MEKIGTAFTGVLAIFLAFGIISIDSVNAHKPLKASDNNDSFATATRIFNHTISWAVYEELDKENPIDYYSFTANKGERFYAQLLIPKLEKFINFRPSLALIGNGLSADIKNVHSENTIQEHYATDSDALPFSLPQRTEATVVDYTGIIPSTEFYEPFTQTSYWERQEVVIDNLPASGTYFVVIFDRNIISQLNNNNNNNNSSSSTGKYSLAIGEIEDFSPYDLFTTLPRAWFDTKFFFEDYTMPTVVIAVAITVPVIVGTSYLIRGRRRQSKSQNLRPK